MNRARSNPKSRPAAGPQSNAAPQSSGTRERHPEAVDDDRRADPTAALEPNFGRVGGLVPAVVQDVADDAVLMVAFMNREAWDRTLATGYAHYYSRSRGRIWKKGESSGHVQEVKEIRIDCDEDTLLLRVVQVGETACHTGNRSCFYRRVFP